MNYTIRLKREFQESQSKAGQDVTIDSVLQDIPEITVNEILGSSRYAKVEIAEENLDMLKVKLADKCVITPQVNAFDPDEITRTI